MSMEVPLTGFLVVLIAGSYVLFQPSMTEGVRSHGITDLSEDLNLGEGTCAAKLENTNSYPVRVNYKFSGVKSKTTQINNSSTSLVEGIGCSKASMEIIRVDKLE